VKQYLAISPYNKEHYFVAFRDRTIKYNFTGAPPEWMQQMQEVFYQWQAESVQRTQPLPQAFTPPHMAPYAQQPQQWNPPPVQLPAPHNGYSSPQMLPNSPMSGYSNTSPPPLSPNPPAVFAHYATAPQFAAVEMMGSVPEGPPVTGMLAVPMSKSTPSIHTSSDVR
jgi:hypothetical protein